MEVPPWTATKLISCRKNWDGSIPLGQWLSGSVKPLAVSVQPFVLLGGMEYRKGSRGRGSKCGFSSANMAVTLRGGAMDTCVGPALIPAIQICVRFVEALEARAFERSFLRVSDSRFDFPWPRHCGHESVLARLACDTVHRHWRIDHDCVQEVFGSHNECQGRWSPRWPVVPVTAVPTRPRRTHGDLRCKHCRFLHGHR